MGGRVLRYLFRMRNRAWIPELLPLPVQATAIQEPAPHGLVLLLRAGGLHMQVGSLCAQHMRQYPITRRCEQLDCQRV